MDALSFPFPYPVPVTAPGAFAPADAAAPTRLQAWLIAVGTRLRGTLDGFPDAIWLAGGSAATVAECDEDGRWSIRDDAAAPPDAIVGLMPAMPGVHEVPDVIDDASFDAYPTAACWPMARRLCRIVFEGATPLDPGPVMMLVGSLPGRMTPEHRQALEDWIPASSALLAMLLASGPRR